MTVKIKGGRTMAIELYWGSGSPFAWRVMLTLEVKGLAYESKLLESSCVFRSNPAGDSVRFRPPNPV
jgi:hypothetical protein